MSNERQRHANAYENLIHRVHTNCCCHEEQQSVPCQPSELTVQALWHAGLLGSEGITLRHGKVRILDFGEWNRSVGPDFLRAEIEIEGVRMRGDIEIDPTAQDWERHGHGSNPGYTQVVLHIVLAPPPAGWYTRNEQHIDIPILPIEKERIQSAIGATTKKTSPATALCRTPLDNMRMEHIVDMLQAAAAYRTRNKQRLFRNKVEALGADQSWYEAFAETLGYKINKLPMQILARRTPLKSLGKQAESLLFGTAGFLVPVLPATCDLTTRDYHRRVWDGWWPHRMDFALSEARAIPWQYAPLRPANHPHRRVATLALIAQHWNDIRPNLHAGAVATLTKQLTSLQHPYWSIHSFLPSSAMHRPVALMGAERVQDFLANHIYPADDTPAAWQAFLKLRNRDLPRRVETTAQHLFGNRDEIKKLLHFTYIQQALLQIDADFCVRNSCRDCLFPEQLCQWHPVRS